MTRLLLLAGTTEAREIAAALSGVVGLELVASLAGATRKPLPLGVETRVGGFGGAGGFARYLADEGIGAVLDATHPFAAAMSHRSHVVCERAGVPYAQVLRPSWKQRAEDRWSMIDNEEAAAALIEPGAVVFLATGRQTLGRFTGLAEGRTLWARQIDCAPDPFPFARGGWIVGRPPFPVEHEMTLFRQLGAGWLVVKDAGGEASRSKLDAARALGLRVAMIRRPEQPDALRFMHNEDAVAWARGLAAS